MPLKRPHSPRSVSSDADSFDSDRVRGSSKRVHQSSPPSARQSPVIDHPKRVHILPAKLQSGVLEGLINLVEKSVTQSSGSVGGPELQLTADVEQADVIVTAVHMRPRLERHIDWELAKTKAIVTPEWLRHSINSRTLLPCGAYSAISDLRDETERRCPQVKSNISEHPETPPDASGESQSSTDQGVSVNAADVAALKPISRYCCQRASPLICPNQTLVKELDVIRRSRFLEGEERSMLSYARAIATVKASPYRFSDRTQQADIAKLPFLGEKLVSLVEEFVKTGKIAEAQKKSASSRFSSLSAFNAIHGIGPHTARRLYSLGLRTIEELGRYYEVTPGVTDEDTLSLLESNLAKDEVTTEKSIKIALALRHDLSQTIPRQEVEEICRLVMQELQSVEEGCTSVIAGGYRRGKPQSNDVDIVITHTDWSLGSQKVNGLCKRLVQRLHERGLVKHVLYMSEFHQHNVLRTHHWDSLAKALTVFVLPHDPARERVYRRVDLIFAAPEVFWTAVVGWTGSTMFERDLRLWAKQEKGLKFDSSGISRRHDSKLFFPKSEREVFELLGLTYVPPTLRNADA
ncbi:Nucleotidyltransferase [Paxillus ammoniavirescens]|nr:Nucleotidyltransferase [Paxillus ammoniavirescens]